LFTLSLPGVDNAATIGALTGRLPGLKTAIVSGPPCLIEAIRADECGVHGYLPKSLGSGSVADAIATVLNGSSYTPALPDHGTPLLTPRQRDVLILLAQGKTNKEIAHVLHLGLGTVKVHVAALLERLKVTKRTDAARIDARLLGPDHVEVVQDPTQRLDDAEARR
jgi:DNA-binding NarL/FixJ family response regulator